MYSIIGHQIQKKILLNHFKEKKIFPAYFFYGPSMIGKKTLALQFGKSIVGNNILNLKVYDFNTYLEDFFSVEKFQEIKKQFYLSPLGKSFKIIIFDNFEYCSEIIQNALLKIIEEPPENNIFIFISQFDIVIPTLVSRFFKIKFNALSDKEMENFIQAQNKNIESKILQKIMIYSGKKPGLALHMLTDLNFFKKVDIFLNNYLKIINAPLVTRLNFFEQYLNTENKSQAILFLDILLGFLNYLIYKNPIFEFTQEAEFILKAKSIIIKDKSVSFKLLIDALAFRTLP